jgi:hypothetical protein
MNFVIFALNYLLRFSVIRPFRSITNGYVYWMLWHTDDLCSDTHALGGATHVIKTLRTVFVATYVHFDRLTLRWIYFYDELIDLILYPLSFFAASLQSCIASTREPP